MMRPKALFQLGRASVSAWVDDAAPSMGAAIAYYTIFSLAPLLVIVIAIAGAMFGAEAVQGQISTQLSGLIGSDGATAVEGLIESASEPGRGLIAGAISIVVLLVGATTVFAEIQSALDRIWHVPDRAKPSGLWGLLRARVLSAGLILGLAFLLMVSLVVSAGLAAFGSWSTGLLPGWEVLLQVLNVAVSLGILTVLFAMIFKFMPSTPIGWNDVWVGAIVTAVLFEVGKVGIGLYLGKSGVNESFAAAGSLVVLLAWVYYAAQIFLLGAEFTKVYADDHGSVAGRKATEATARTAQAAAAGTEAVVPGRPEPPTAAAEPSLADARRADADSERRLALATRGLGRELLLLAVTALATTVSAKRRKRQRQRKQASRPR